MSGDLPVGAVLGPIDVRCAASRLSGSAPSRLSLMAA